MGECQPPGSLRLSWAKSLQLLTLLVDGLLLLQLTPFIGLTRLRSVSPHRVTPLCLIAQPAYWLMSRLRSCRKTGAASGLVKMSASCC